MPILAVRVARVIMTINVEHVSATTYATITNDGRHQDTKAEVLAVWK